MVFRAWRHNGLPVEQTLFGEGVGAVGHRADAVGLLFEILVVHHHYPAQLIGSVCTTIFGSPIAK
jgi:hypothetical protein